MPGDDKRADATGGKPPAGSASLYRLAKIGGCPRCGAPTLFAGILRFADRCPSCGLSFDAFNVGDGPAAFLTLGIGTIVTILAIVAELAFEPQWWVHVLLWLPLTIGSVLITTRWAKAVLLAIEYRNNAHESRFGSDK